MYLQIKQYTSKLGFEFPLFFLVFDRPLGYSRLGAQPDPCKDPAIKGWIPGLNTRIQELVLMSPVASPERCTGQSDSP